MDMTAEAIKLIQDEAVRAASPHVIPVAGDPDFIKRVMLPDQKITTIAADPWPRHYAVDDSGR